MAATAGGVVTASSVGARSHTPTSHDAPWDKGDQATNLGGASSFDLVWTTWVTRPNSDTPIFGPQFTYLELATSRRYEFILVGTKIHNLKLVTARRLITFPAP